MFKKTKSSLAVTLSVAMLATMVTIPGVASAATATKLEGKDRYETALKIVEAGWTKSDSAVIARGDNLADALAAAPLAYAKGKAPILLTKTNEISAAVLKELKDLGVKNVYIVGGVGAVSASVEKELKDAGLTIKRVSGNDRFETSLEIAKEAFGVAPAEVVIANGLSYVDALSVSSVAASKGMPILLVNNNKLSVEQAAYVAGKTVYAIGGEGVLNADVVTASKAIRVSGLDRYKTNAAVLTQFKPDYTKIYVAKGTQANYVDALAGSALAAITNSPIVLVDGNNKINAEQEAVVKANIMATSSTVLLGGTVTQAAADAIDTLKTGDVALSSVTAVSAKAFKVTFSSPVDTTKAVIQVMRGTVKPSVKSVTFSEDKKSAVIEFTTSLAAGDYTTTVTGLSATALTATTKVEAEKLTKIDFLSDVAIFSTTTTTTSITTNVKAENQYGEDISTKLASANVTASKGAIDGSITKGALKLTSPSAYTVGEKVVVTIVDSATGVVATKALTVAQAADVKSIEFGTIKTDDKDLAGKEINVKAMTTNAGKYYLPITVKNQYGTTLKAADLKGSVNILTSNENVIKIASTQIEDTDNGTVIKFQSTSGISASGTVVLTAVASATGVTANTTITVKENAKLDVVTLAAPATELKMNTATVLPVTVLDSYAKEVALTDVTFTGLKSSTITLDADTKITATNATFDVVHDYVKGTASIKITPTDKNVILTVTTATGKYQSLILTANAKPVVSAIKGVSADFATMLANDISLDTKLVDQVEFVDQYGVDIDAPAFGTLYTITAKDDTNAITTVTTPGSIVASTTAGNETYVITLKNDKGVVIDTKEVTITVVDAKKITAFAINDMNKFYINSAANATHTQDIDISGLVDGKKVVVNQTMAKDFYASNGLTGIAQATGLFTPSASVTTPDNKDVASTVTVIVDNGASTYTLTKDVMYSDATPKAASLAITLDKVEVTGAVQITPVTGEDINVGTDKLVIVAKDQYGKKIASGYRFVVTSNTSKLGTISIDTNGVITTSGTFINGDSFQINATINGITKAIKVIIG